MRSLKIWTGDGREPRIYAVRQDDIDVCLALPKSADRYDYWRRVTGDQTIDGPVLVWTPDGDLHK